MMRALSRAGGLGLLVVLLLSPVAAAGQAETPDAAPAAAPLPDGSEPPRLGLPADLPAARQLPGPPVQQRARVLPKPKAGGLFDYTEEKANVFKIGFALGVAALVLWGMVLEKRGRGRHRRKERRAALALLGILGVFGWFNYGKFHSGTFVHVWEHYHYYIGAKYLPELHYARLYECSAIAESELRGADRVARRKMRDIADTNLIRSTADILAHPERCKEHFSPERWESFKTDVAFFMKRMGDSQWERSQKDHGYNGTPWWSIGGTLLANLVGPASERTMNLLGLLDPILLVTMFAGIWWAFGVEIFAVAASFFAINFPSRYYWNGGAFLRYDYLAMTILGICLLRKGKAAWGGGLLAYGGALRLFPVMFSVGPAVQAVWRWVREKAFPREHRKVLVGAAIATALLVPASLWVAQEDFSLYSDFSANTLKHSDTPLTNHMGLRTVVSWRFSDNGYHLKDSSLDDPWKIWKESRLANYRSLLWLFVLLNLAALWAIGRATRKDPAWVAATLSGVVLVTTAVELTCYYYAYLLAGAFLMEKKKEIGLWLLALGVASHAVVRLHIWDDDKYVLQSVLALVWCGGTLWTLLKPELVREGAEGPAAAEPVPALAATTAAAVGPAPGPHRKKRKR